MIAHISLSTESPLDSPSIGPTPDGCACHCENTVFPTQNRIMKNCHGLLGVLRTAEQKKDLGWTWQVLRLNWGLD